jgi:hypothetical protein
MSLDLRCNNYTIRNECYILFCDAISDLGNSNYIFVLPLAKGRTLQNGIRALVFPVGSRT